MDIIFPIISKIMESLLSDSYDFTMSKNDDVYHLTVTTKPGNKEMTDNLPTLVDLWQKEYGDKINVIPDFPHLSVRKHWVLECYFKTKE